MVPEPQLQVTPPRLLLRSSLLRPVSPGGAGSSPSSGALSHGHGHHLALETWRSETLIRVIAAFWLETGGQAGTDQRPPSPGQVSQLHHWPVTGGAQLQAACSCRSG